MFERLKPQKEVLLKVSSTLPESNATKLQRDFGLISLLNEIGQNHLQEGLGLSVRQVPQAIRKSVLTFPCSRAVNAAPVEIQETLQHRRHSLSRLPDDHEQRVVDAAVSYEADPASLEGDAPVGVDDSRGPRMISSFQVSHNARYTRGSMEWFTVDKAGLSKLIEKKGKAFAVFELLQNSWDTDATNVTVRLEPIAGRPYAKLYVKDDHPDGFKDLAHAFTLFAESEKKGDPSKRGRFNLGEKLVLALCEKAEIMSTKGSVFFTSEGGRRESKERLAVGSSFFGHIRMTREELAEVEHAIGSLLPPEHIETTFNGRVLPVSMVLKSFDAMLPTDIADGEGYLRKLVRKTRVTVHQVAVGENAMLYEMGIPVVELSGGERWHVNVHQKVPLNVDRDNVTPAYLQTIRVLLANEMRDQLTKEDTDQVWINAATEDERVAPEAVEKVLDERFGKKRAIFDPSDPEANKELMNQGYTVIPGGSLSRDQWKNVRAGGLAAPSGQIPSKWGQLQPQRGPRAHHRPQEVHGWATAARPVREGAGPSSHRDRPRSQDRERSHRAPSCRLVQQGPPGVQRRTPRQALVRGAHRRGSQRAAPPRAGARQGQRPPDPGLRRRGRTSRDEAGPNRPARAEFLHLQRLQPAAPELLNPFIGQS